MNRSVRARLVWGSALVTATAMALMVVAVGLVITHLTRSRVDATLRDRVTAVEPTLRHGPDGGLAVTSADGDADLAVSATWIYDADGHLVVGPRAGKGVLATVTALSGVRRPRSVERGDRVFYARPVRVDDKQRFSGVAVTSESLADYEKDRTIIVLGLLAMGVLVTAGTATLTGWTVGRTLRPVRQMTTSAEDWSEHDLDSRFDLGDGTDELTSLGSTLDSLLDKVATAIRNEQRLTSELAHELRTPLTTIRAEAELGLLHADDPAERERLDRIVGQVDRLTATITTLLALARREAGEGHRADVTAVVRSLVEDRDDPITVTLEAPADPLVVAVEPAVVERVVAPVLDNAVVHAGSRVRVVLVADGRQVSLRVEDDGNGFGGDLEEVFEAGVRRAGSIGAGLGLPLARRIATGVGGTVEVLSAREPTIVEIRLPRR